MKESASLRRLVHDLVHGRDGMTTGGEFFGSLGLPVPDRAERSAGGDVWVARLVQVRCRPAYRPAWATTRAAAYVLVAVGALERDGRECPDELLAAATLLITSGEGGYDVPDGRRPAP